MSSTYGGGAPLDPGGSPYPTDPFAGTAGAGGTTAGGYATDMGGSSAAGASAARSERPDVEDQSLGSLVGQLTSDVSTLMRQEVALAKAELREEAKKAGKAAGMLGAAGLAGYFVLLFLSLTLMYLLDQAINIVLAALIVTILWGIAGFILYTMGRKKMSEVNPKPEQTVESLKEDKEWVKAQKN
ncbi:MAG TPA: phage holin family protein [Nocardioidaceae bacterium]|jgi:uncharacterized membrane protein YqjE|nr:phage holin family protein [Nocardioidaceae bacterium]